MSIFNSSICLLSISFIDINSNEEIKKWDQSKLSGPVTILPRIGESIIFFDNMSDKTKIMFNKFISCANISFFHFRKTFLLIFWRKRFRKWIWNSNMQSKKYNPGNYPGKNKKIHYYHLILIFILKKMRFLHVPITPSLIFRYCFYIYKGV